MKVSYHNATYTTNERMKISFSFLMILLFIGCHESTNKLVNRTPIENKLFNQHLINKLKNFYDTVTVANRENRIYVFNTPENKLYITALYFKTKKGDISSEHLLSIDLGSCIASVDFGLERYLKSNIKAERQQDSRIDDRAVKAVSFYDSSGHFITLKDPVFPIPKPVETKSEKLYFLNSSNIRKEVQPLK